MSCLSFKRCFLVLRKKDNASQGICIYNTVEDKHSLYAPFRDNMYKCLYGKLFNSFHYSKKLVFEYCMPYKKFANARAAFAFSYLSIQPSYKGCTHLQLWMCGNIQG